MSSLGVDLHTNSFTVARRTMQGKEKVSTYPLSEIDRFRKTLRKTDQVAVEATGNTRYFVGCISDRVERVVVVNPSKFDVIRKSVKKTDKNDASSIAFFLSKDMLPESRMKSEESARVNSLAVSRDKLVKHRTALINKIHNLLNSFGIKVKKESLSSLKGLNAAMSHKIDEVALYELEVLVEQIIGLNKSVKKLDSKIVELGSKLKGYENLKSIKGIGERSAAVLVSVIGDIKDFSDEGKLASYFGIVPRVSDSNETVRHGRITKRGTKLGRTTLVQCTLVAIRYSSYLKDYYDGIKSRRGSGKAIIATSRKLLGIIYNTLKNDWIFEDFTNYVLKDNKKSS